MEDDNDEIGDKRMLNKMKDKKRHRSAPKKETLECSKESFKKMKDEIDELRRNEVERAVELEDLRRKIENRGAERSMNEVEYALNFDKNAYLERGFIESAKWIKNVLAKTMLEEMSRKEFRHKFESLMIEKNTQRTLACVVVRGSTEGKNAIWAGGTRLTSRDLYGLLSIKHINRKGKNMNKKEEMRCVFTSARYAWRHLEPPLDTAFSIVRGYLRRIGS